MLPVLRLGSLVPSLEDKLEYFVQFRSPQQLVITYVQNSRPSLLIRQLNMKKKNPWNPLKMTNRYWNAVEASLTVRAPKSHVKPNITIIPTMLIIVLIVALADFFFFIVWVTSTRTERMKITMLNKISANMGARNVTKNTIGSLMKQLWRKKFSIIQPITL